MARDGPGFLIFFSKFGLIFRASISFEISRNLGPSKGHGHNTKGGTGVDGQ